MSDVIGKTIGSYTVLAQLGAGAMGEVYLAEHRHLKRKAALKLLAREIVDRPDLLERFFLEARATSAIAHPGIVQIFDCEVDAGGRPYIVMEHLTGETLAATLARRGPLPSVTAARMARGIAEALDAAHGKGIVHRDLKPENIFVEPNPPDAIKLVDFGIAKLAGDFQASQVHKTRSGSVLGTPLYMSPEQCRDSANIDFRTDIYSLGCVVHEMLTGRPPFTQDNLGDLIVAHMTATAPDVRELNPAVPEGLAQLVSELLRKVPAQRPASMRAIVDRLAAFLARATTVPAPGAPAANAALAAFAPAAAAHATGGTPPPKTTFGDAASEMTSDDLPARPRRRPLLFGALTVALVAGAFLVTRGRGNAPTAVAPVKPATTTPTTPAAPVEPPPAAPAEPTKHKPVAEQPRGTAHLAGSERNKRRVAQGTAVPPEPAPAAATKPAASAARAGEPSPPRPAPLPGFAGSWEGPWNDPEHNQKGRFSLQVSDGGAVAGWMANTGAHQTFRMVGTLTPAGLLELVCQCPANQSFVAKGSVRATEDGELRGQLALSNSAATFGQSHLTLKRTPR